MYLPSSFLRLFLIAGERTRTSTMQNDGDSQQQQELQQLGNDALSEAVAVDHLKHVVGMMFDTLTDVDKFYKPYAHEAGFSVRVGQHKKQNDEYYSSGIIVQGKGIERRT